MMGSLKVAGLRDTEIVTLTMVEFLLHVDDDPGRLSVVHTKEIYNPILSRKLLSLSNLMQLSKI
jgi:hypothetical protein